MKILGVIGLGFFAFLFLLVLIFWGTHNRLVGLKVEVETQQGQIEAQLQRRFDLVPNLVSAVRGAMSQERAVFEAIADARTKYAGTQSGTPERMEASNTFESALSRLLVIMENYPELKSVDRVQDLMVQLEGSENRISVARQRYNESVREYNGAVRRFPTNIIAGMFGFREAVMFESVEGAKEAPKVDLEVK